MTATYTALATITLTSADSEIVFSSIPATYRDLVIVANIKATEGNFLLGRLNSDSGSNYSRVVMAGNGSTTESFAAASVTSLDPGTRISTNWSSVQLQFFDYAQTNKHKTVLGRLNSPTETGFAPVAASAMRWANTNAVNTISLRPDSSSWAIGSTFSLYGIN